VRRPDAGGCYSWSAAACAPHLLCLAGECVCENPCQANQVQCEGLLPALVACAGPDENGCSFWGTPAFCEDGEACKGEVGVGKIPACVTYTPPICADRNECDFVGQKVCMADTKYRECYVRAEDGCLRLDCFS